MFNSNRVMSKLRFLAKLVPLIAIGLATGGCVGVFIPHTRTETFKQPNIAERPAAGAVSAATGKGGTYTAAWLHNHWGQPASINPGSSETRGELWTYKFGTQWHGIVPCVIVPVPLVLPFGRVTVTFLVEDGRVISADVVGTHVSGAAAGLLGPEGHSWSMAEW